MMTLLSPLLTSDVANTNSHTVSVIAVSRQLEAVYDDKAGTDAIGPGNLESTPSEASGGDLACIQLRAAIDHITRWRWRIAAARYVRRGGIGPPLGGGAGSSPEPPLPPVQVLA